VLEVLQELQFSVGSFGKDWGTEGLHDLLDGDILVRELVSGGAARQTSQHEIVTHISGRAEAN
jgi:hypothetical protein